MKKIIAIIVFLPFLVQAQLIQSLPKGSKLTWKGGPLIGSGHEGTIEFKSGSLTLSSLGTITSISKGEFVLDMSTIKSTDIKNTDLMRAKDLEDHLKSDDFFAVEKFPTASFALVEIRPSLNFTEANKYIVSGMLTMKGTTKKITFPATITDGDALQIDGVFTIDRTQWDVNYQSKTIYSYLKDNIISDEIQITIHLNFGGC